LNEHLILPTFTLSDPSPHVVVSFLELKVCNKGSNLTFAVTEVRLFFSLLSTPGALTLKYQTDIEVEVSEMREECVCRAPLFATVLSRRTDHFEGQSAVLQSGKDPLATSEDSTFRI
jgi:hypothetical protein